LDNVTAFYPVTRLDNCPREERRGMKGEWVVGREMAFDTMGSRVRVRVRSYSFDLLYGGVPW
jgi:hypothetical protein